MPRADTTVLRYERAAGLLTLMALAAALIVANSPLRGLYDRIHHTPVIIQVGRFGINEPLIFWINEGLMVFFFLLLGLEIKREILEGQLSGTGRFALPAIAALGGMAVPAAVYAALNLNDPTELHGWAIPTATDVVLALTALSLVGAHVPASLRVFLAALAIFDDIGAIAIIALFYTERLSIGSLAAAAGAVLVLGMMNRFAVTRGAAYTLSGVVLWLALMEAGVQPTLSGVVLAFAIPMWVGEGVRRRSPLRDAERQLRSWTAFGIVPLFTFFNAGINLGDVVGSSLVSTVSLGVLLGLVIGKQVGVFGAAWLAIQFGMAKLPPGVGWRHLYGVSLLAGIGFTMSLFIAGLAFAGQPVLASARLGVLLASALSAGLGVTALTLVQHKDSED